VESKPAGGKDSTDTAIKEEERPCSEWVFLSGQSEKFGMEIGPSRKARDLQDLLLPR
jgi:hypothetical protein